MATQNRSWLLLGHIVRSGSNMFPQTYKIVKNDKIDDGMGGFTTGKLEDVITILGYMDFLSGTDLNTSQNAIIADSTHVLVTVSYHSGIDETMRVLDKNDDCYEITFVDNPGTINHHLEIYLRRLYGGK